MEELPFIQSSTSAPTYIASSQLEHRTASDFPSVSSNVTYTMGSAGPKHFWRNHMAPCRTAAKTSLVHRFTQVLLNPSKEDKGAKEEAEEHSAPVTPSASKLTSCRRMRLELDVERLHARLQQEIDLHSALENAIAHAAGAFATFPRNIPPDAQELLTDVAMLEVAVSRLEEQMIGLNLQIRYERNQRLHDAASRLASSLLPNGTSALRERLEDLPHKARDLPDDVALYGRKFKGSLEQVCHSDHSDETFWSAIGLSNHSQSYTSTSEITSLEEDNLESAHHTLLPNEECTMNSILDISGLHVQRDSDAEVVKNGFESSMTRDTECVSETFSRSAMEAAKPLVDGEELLERRATKLNDSMQGKSSSLESNTMWKQPNRLSEEMVSCMIGIYCHLADDPSVVVPDKHINSDNVPSPSSPFEHLTSSSFSSLSDLSNLSLARSPPFEPKIKEQQGMESNVDPYRTKEKLPWGDIGSYSSAVEVSWMSVGKEQLEYAADALRIFRCLVEQLSKVDVTSLGHQEKLAFWINVYNALMMHAYLAYGVPKNDVKYFSLMQKAAYTVGGHFFNAMAIEHVLLRGRAPSYRPQIALLLALHKLKIPEGASKFAISRREPLVTFALSCGAWSSPAVRIYTPENVQVQLQVALHDYVRASVNITQHGKLLVPKLLNCYVRDLSLHTATGEADEGLAVALWLCKFLPAHQATLVRDAMQQRAGCPSSAVITIQPFDFRLRYLFLHQRNL
eukprot:c20977_g1_i1 orf=357-2570(-)